MAIGRKRHSKPANIPNLPADSVPDVLTAKKWNEEVRRMYKGFPFPIPQAMIIDEEEE